MDEKNNQNYIMNCPNCNNKIDVNDKFCKNCGNPIIIESQNNYSPQIISSEVLNPPTLKELMDGFEAIKAKPYPKYEEPDSMEKKVNGSNYKNKAAEFAFTKKCEEEREKELADYIINYPLPNSKEELTEFMLLASSKVDINTLEDVITKAWYSKMNQILSKARFSITDINDLKTIEDIYNNKEIEIKEGNLNSRRFTIGLIGSLLLIALAFFNIILFIFVVIMLFLLYKNKEKVVEYFKSRKAK